MRKYADISSDKASLVEWEELQVIEAATHRLGKTSLSELEPDERQSVLHQSNQD